jgi:hypothetical protein
MKKILFVGLFLPYVLFAFDSNMCATYMGKRHYNAKVHDKCEIDENLKNWIKCRDFYKRNMLNGLDYNGKKKVAVNPTFYYTYYNDRIREVLLAEVKKVVNKLHGIMCIENSEAKLLEYQESISEHEWCYAPMFLKALDDEDMSEHEMKYDYFFKLYNMRSAVLESKEKPKNKEILCGVYLDCMSSFIRADHTEVSSGLIELYEKTKKECFPDYFVLEASINVKMHKNIAMRKYKPGSRNITRKGSFSSKGVFYINPQNNSIELRKIKNDLIQQNTNNIQQKHFLGNKSYNINVKQKKHRSAPGINISLSMRGNKDKKIEITANPIKYPTKYHFTIDLDKLLKQGEYRDHSTSKKRASEPALSKALMQHIGMSVQTGASGGCSIYIHRANKKEVEKFKLYDRE